MYPPYDLYPYQADNTDNPPLNYTKVCEPGRSGEANASCVVLVTEIAGGSTAVPDTWPSRFPSYTAKFGGDFTASLTKPTGKKDATVTMSGGTPVVSWTPVLSAAEAAKRTYTILGRQSLLSGDWTVVPSGQEANYNFFKVRVTMK